MIRTISRLFHLFSRRDRQGAALLMALLLVGAVFEVVGVGAIPVFVALLASPDTVFGNAYAGPVLARLGVDTTAELTLWGGGALVFVFVAKNLYLAGLTYAQARFTQNKQAALSERLFRSYLANPYPFHLQRNTSDLLRNTAQEVGNLVSGVMMPLLYIAMEGLVIALVAGLLLAVEPVVSLVTLSVLGGITAAFFYAVRKKTTWYATHEQDHRGRAMQAVNEGLGGIKDVKVLGREAYFAEAYARSLWFNTRAAQYRAVIGGLPRLFLEVVVMVGILAVAAILIAQGRSSAQVIPVLTLLAAAAVRLMPSFIKIMLNVNSLQWGRVSLDLVYDDLMAETEAPGRPGAQALAHDSATRGTISLEGVSYRYPGAPDDALRDVTLEIPGGSTVAFVGPSGAGKTTLVDLLLSLLKPTEGRITVDGHDLADDDVRGVWRGQIGYVPQAIYLTDASVRRNVAFGIDDAEIDDAAVWAALDAAQLASFVAGLPEGLDTPVGDRGVRLSGGQRQRIGIARALYHDPAVLVLDEATSALDNQTERTVVEAIERLRGSRTIVTIAHRLSTVRRCDRLFMLADGRLAGSGTYEALVEDVPAFAEMAA